MSAIELETTSFSLKRSNEMYAQDNVGRMQCKQVRAKKLEFNVTRCQKD